MRRLFLTLAALTAMLAAGSFAVPQAQAMTSSLPAAIGVAAQGEQTVDKVRLVCRRVCNWRGCWRRCWHTAPYYGYYRPYPYYYGYRWHRPWRPWRHW